MRHRTMLLAVFTGLAGILAARAAPAPPHYRQHFHGDAAAPPVPHRDQEHVVVAGDDPLQRLLRRPEGQDRQMQSVKNSR